MESRWQIREVRPCEVERRARARTNVSSVCEIVERDAERGAGSGAVRQCSATGR